jgi:Adenylate cyclase, family 3 (some proteins contain HAMP domain)
VDKYIGDAVMAFWNAPRRVPNHAYLACRSALQNRIGCGITKNGMPEFTAI